MAESVAIKTNLRLCDIRLNLGAEMEKINLIRDILSVKSDLYSGRRGQFSTLFWKGINELIRQGI